MARHACNSSVTHLRYIIIFWLSKCEADCWWNRLWWIPKWQYLSYRPIDSNIDSCIDSTSHVFSIASVDQVAILTEQNWLPLLRYNSTHWKSTCLFTRLESLAWSQQGFWQLSFYRKCDLWSLCFDGGETGWCFYSSLSRRKGNV